MSKLEVGKQYAVTDEEGHCFSYGDMIELVSAAPHVSDDGTYYDFKGVSKNFGFSVTQLLGEDQFIDIAPEMATLRELIKAEPVPRVTYLYVVEDDDGVYGKTFDRDHAREIKASYGGKKAGVVITAYAAVKEIR